MSSPLLYQLSYLVTLWVVIHRAISSLVFSVAAKIMESHCHCDLHSSLEALHAEVNFEHPKVVGSNPTLVEVFGL